MASGDGAGRTRLGLLALCSMLLVPWAVLGYDRGPTTLLFAWGTVTPAQSSVTDAYAYFFRYTAGLPDWILAWAVGIACLLAALVSATAGHVRGREDPRVTAGLLALVGLASVVVSIGFAGQPGRYGLPLGAAVAVPLSGWYWLRHRGR